MTVKEALQKIVDNKHDYWRGQLYAVNYAKYGLTIPDDKVEELRVQCLYVLANISYWRGQLAREVRARLKAFTQ